MVFSLLRHDSGTAHSGPKFLLWQKKTSKGLGRGGGVEGRGGMSQYQQQRATHKGKAENPPMSCFRGGLPQGGRSQYQQQSARYGTGRVPNQKELQGGCHRTNSKEQPIRVKQGTQPKAALG